MSHPLVQLAFRVSAIAAAAGVAAAVLAAAVGLILLTVLPSTSTAATTQACGKADVVPAGGQDYLALNNVWNADTPQCVAVGDQTLRVDRAEHDLLPVGSPAASPALLKGCHWEICSDGGGLPVQVDRMPAVTSDWVSSLADAGTYSAAYAVWFHSEPTIDGAPDGAEMSIRLAGREAARPGGLLVGGSIPLSGASWDVWFEQAEGRNRIVYERIGDVSSVDGLDIRAFTRDSLGRGWVEPEWYLVGVEAGFHLWSGGTGNAIERFSVSVDGRPTTSAPPEGQAGCSARLAVDQTWSTGFMATVVVTNSGGRPLRGWAVDWTFPADQEVRTSWDAVVVQRGRAVRAVNADYNGSIEVAGTTSFGLVGSGPPPTGLLLTCVPL